MKIVKAFKHVTNWAGNVSAISLFVLTLCIFYGVIAREAKFQDYFTYEISLYALVWYSLLSTGINAQIGKHVTAGFSIENFVKTKFPIFPFIRTLLVIAIMIVIFLSGVQQTYVSYSSHQVTTSIAEMPVWISLFSVVVGSLSWMIGEAGRFIELVVSSK